MINEQCAHTYCKDDITKIENYDKAINDTTQTWHLHHILGEILTREQLLEHDFYYDVPPCMLKFVTKSEHASLHRNGRTSPMKGKKMSEESRNKISESKKGKKIKPFSEEHRKRISESLTGNKFDEEHRRNLSESHKGKHQSAETRKKISEAKKNISNETRRKMREAWARRKAAKEK